MIRGTVAVHGSVAVPVSSSPSLDDGPSPVDGAVVLSLTVAVTPLVEASVKSEIVDPESSADADDLDVVNVSVNVDLIVVLAVLLRVDSCGRTDET